MSVVDHLKDSNPEQKILEVAFGRHSIEGDLAKSDVTGTVPNHVVTVQHLLGEAFGKGWKGIVGAWFRGINRPPDKYKFYPGIQSPSNADATQGIDTVFDQDTPHSNTAWLRLECPSGNETGIPDADTKGNPPTGTKVIADCQMGDIYDDVGDVVQSNQLLTNPADVIAFGCREIRRYPNSRIDFESLDVLRNQCNQSVMPDYTTLQQGVGLTGKYYEGAAFDTLKSSRVDPVIQYELSSGAPALDLTPTGFSVTYEGKIKFDYSETYTLYLTHNDSGKLFIDNLSTPLINETAAATTSATFAATAGVFYDIKIEWTNSSAESQMLLEWESASRSRQTVPQDALYPKNEAQKRYESHLAFTSGTNFHDFLESVLFTCNGEYQDVDGKLRFFSLDDPVPVFNLNESNIVRGSFNHKLRFSQQDLLKLPTRFIAEGRDLQSRYLNFFDPQVFVDVADLRDMGIKNEEIVVVGNTTRAQCLRNLTHYAKIRTAPKILELEGMPQTYPIMKGDFVTVTHPNAAYTNKLHLVLEATDKAIGKNADERIFKLLDWS